MARLGFGIGYLLLGTLAATACGAGAEPTSTTDDGERDVSVDDVGQTSQEIRRATPAAANELLGLVQVSTTRGNCSGTVIASDTILTAAHCFCGEDLVGSNDCVHDAQITYRNHPTSGIGRELHGTAHVHPDYNPSWTEGQYEHDVAVVTVDGEAPAWATPVELTESYLKTGTIVRVAGFGHTGSDCSGPIGTLNSDTTDIESYEDGHDIMTFDTFVFCHGDSGGPVLDAAGKQRAVFSMQTPWTQKAITTGSEFDWIKGHMCRSTPKNRCDGHGTTCNCTASKQVLWQNAQGQLTLWTLNGGAVSQTIPGTVASEWQVQGSGDFDGDGQGDILWRHTTGQTAIWFMRDGVNVGQAYPGGQDPGLTWKIQGTGDFDGDGRSDILWRHSSGQLAIWFEGDINHATYPSYRNQGGPVDNRYVVRGIGDFDADGKADILWVDGSGNVSIWYMSAGTLVGEGYPGYMSTATKVAAVGDFDGNLQSDILWRDVNGRLWVWFGGEASGNSIDYQNTAGPGNTAWQVQGVGDFDHDGRDDILWKDNKGKVAVWLVLGSRFNGDLYPPPVDASSKVRGMLAQSGF